MTDIQTLMSRDPLEYSKQDLEEVIAVFRSARKQFTLGDMKAGSGKMTEKQKEVKELGSRLGLKISL